MYIFSSQLIWIALLSWTPAITGIVCAKVFYPGERVLGIKAKIRPVYLILGVIIPFVCIIPSCMISWSIVGDPANMEKLSAFIAVDLLLYLVLAAGEEIGWRGFAYPVLKRVYGPFRAVLINGTLWAVWHFALILTGKYSFPVDFSYGIAIFTAGCIIESVICGWLRTESGSIVPVIIFHSLYNILCMDFLEAMTTNEKTFYLAGETGIITLLFTLAAATVLIRSRKNEKHEAETAI